MTPLFKLDPACALPIPVLAIGPDDVPRVADGARFLTAEQAAAASGLDVAQLLALYRGFARDLATADAGPAGNVGDGSFDASFDAARPGPVAETVTDLHTGETVELDPATLSDAEITERARRRQRGNLTADEWAQFVAHARAMGYDIDRRECYPKRVVNADTGEAQIACCAKIEVLEARSLASPSFDGRDPLLYCGPDGKWVESWHGREPPVACRVTYHRKGVSRGFTVEGTWAEFTRGKDLRADGQLADEHWRENGVFMLGKCTRAKGMREAYRDAIGNVYLAEEFSDAPRGRAARDRRAAARDARDGHGDLLPGDDEATGPRLVRDDDCDLDVEAPSTLAECRAQMRKVGCAVDLVQDAVIAAGRKRHGRLERDDPRQFWSLVLTEAIKRFRNVG